MGELAKLQPQCTFYPDKRDQDDPDASLLALRKAIEEVLGLDPRTPQSRSARGATSEQTRHRYWALDFDALSVAFRIARQPSRSQTDGYGASTVGGISSLADGAEKTSKSEQFAEPCQ